MSFRHTLNVALLLCCCKSVYFHRTVFCNQTFNVVGFFDNNNAGYIPVVVVLGYIPDTVVLGYIPDAVVLGYLITTSARHKLVLSGNFS